MTKIQKKKTWAAIVISKVIKIVTHSLYINLKKMYVLLIQHILISVQDVTKH